MKGCDFYASSVISNSFKRMGNEGVSMGWEQVVSKEEGICLHCEIFIFVVGTLSELC